MLPSIVIFFSILIFITFASIKEVRQEVRHIGYVLLLVISNIIKSVKKYLTDCFCKNRKITYQIDDSNNDFEQFELSDNNHTQYVSL